MTAVYKLFDDRLQSTNALLELSSTILHILEEVETSAARTQENGVAWLSKFVASFHAVLHIVCIANRQTELVEVVVQLLVISTKVNDSLTLLLYEVEDVVIVVAFVLSPEDKDSRSLHALECIPASIDVGSL